MKQGSVTKLEAPKEGSLREPQSQGTGSRPQSGHLQPHTWKNKHEVHFLGTVFACGPGMAAHLPSLKTHTMPLLSPTPTAAGGNLDCETGAAAASPDQLKGPGHSQGS